MTAFAPVTLGLTNRSVEAGGFVFTDTTHAAGLRLGPHRHQNAALSLVTHGTYEQHAAGTVFACDRRRVLAEPPQRDHETRYLGVPTRTFILELTGGAQLLTRAASRWFERYDLIAHPAVVRAMETLAAEFGCGGSFDAPFLHASAADTVAQLASEFCAPDRPLARRIAEHLHDRVGAGVRIHDIARDVSRHPAHVCRAFRQEFRISIGAYARVLQVRTTLRELRGDDSLAQIAQNAGFSDQSHFGRVFRAHTGLSPRAFRTAAARSRGRVRRAVHTPF
jgi:AraC family transcriptional regulator